MPYKDAEENKRCIQEYRKTHSNLIKEKMSLYYNTHKDDLRKSQNEYKRTPEVRLRQRQRFVFNSYNLTPEQHTELLDKQGYRCAFPHCGVKVDIFSPIDHDHGCCPTNARSCGKCVRSVLCSLHNTGLGFFEKLNPECLLDAYIYLKGQNAMGKGVSTVSQGATKA